MVRKVYKPGALTNRIRQVDRNIRAAANLAVDAAARLAQANLIAVVATWETKLTFSIQRAAPIKRLILVGGQGDAVKVWGYVDQGTKPHLIFPKEGKLLAFKPGYSPRTRPIANFNTGSGKASGETVFSRGVAHPGTKARKFAGYAGLQAFDVLLFTFKKELKKV